MWIEDEGINLLGAPIGSREYVEEEVRKKEEKVRVHIGPTLAPEAI